jgi:hypothetical protein
MEVTELAVAVAVRVEFAIFVPDQLERHFLLA